MKVQVTDGLGNRHDYVMGVDVAKASKDEMREVVLETLEGLGIIEPVTAYDFIADACDLFFNKYDTDPQYLTRDDAKNMLLAYMVDAFDDAAAAICPCCDCC